MSTTGGRPDPDDDVDARFRAIMDAEFGPAPDTSDLADARARVDAGPAGLTGPAEPVELADLAEPAWRPEPPRPIPRPTGRVAAGAVLMTLALLCFAADLAGVPVPSALALAAVGCFAGGLALLLASLPREPRDPWDDGSRV